MRVLGVPFFLGGSPFVPSGAPKDGGCYKNMLISSVIRLVYLCLAASQ